MKNKISKFGLIILMVSIVCMSMLVPAQAATTENELVYSISNNEVTITDYTGSATDLIIPEEIEGYPVTSICNRAFLHCDSLENITIPDSVTSIGGSAFGYCENLMNVTFGKNSNLTSIGDYAFEDCGSLGNITIPDSVTSIGESAFCYCENLERVTFGKNSNLTSIGDYVFYECDYLGNITIPDSVTSIGESAFGYCENLIRVAFGKNSNLTSIGRDAFSFCDRLAIITILNPDCTIYDSANTIYTDTVIFGHDNSTAHAYAEKYDRIFVSFDGDATDVILSGYAGDNADFTITRDGKMTITGSGNMYNYDDTSGRPWNKYCAFIKSVSIADTITSIGDYAFEDCGRLENSTIPNSVTHIGSYAFEDCTNLASVTFGENSQLTSFDDYAFAHCVSLTDITIPASVEYISNSAFYRCSGLATITIPDSVTGIGYYAFEDCDSLVNITIPASVTGIGYSAFKDCDSLESITILNPKCSINNSADTISDTAVIYGYDNSTAKSYARQYNRSFVALECDHTNSTPIAAVDATCTKDGNTAGSRCNVCQVTTGYTVIPATGHAYSSEITKQPTHEATGIERFTCANCGDTYTETLPKLTDHAYNAVVTAPTCTEQGYTTYTCICGDTYIGDYTDANGHTDEIVPGYAAKCEATGLTDGAVCAICGVVTLAQEVIPALDHNYITVGAYPATCQSTGFTGITYCSVCSTVANYGESTPVAEHKMSDWIVTSEATCTANGKKIKMCTCGLVEEEVIPATGHSDDNSNDICDSCNLNLQPETEQPTQPKDFFASLLAFLNGLLEWFKNLFALFG